MVVRIAEQTSRRCASRLPEGNSSSRSARWRTSLAVNVRPLEAMTCSTARWILSWLTCCRCSSVTGSISSLSFARPIAPFLLCSARVAAPVSASVSRSSLAATKSASSWLCSAPVLSSVPTWSLPTTTAFASFLPCASRTAAVSSVSRLSLPATSSCAPLVICGARRVWDGSVSASGEAGVIRAPLDLRRCMLRSRSVAGR
mmetsp:Transcript_63150/g.137320  ORF Transcript_63150/g.137320 Transcript_63150/m.137320 type:complete len:201 (-) Transcript_63150:83-685(-)